MIYGGKMGVEEDVSILVPNRADSDLCCSSQIFCLILISSYRDYVSSQK